MARTAVAQVLGELELRVMGHLDLFRMRIWGVECLAIASAVIAARGEEDFVSPRLQDSYMVVQALDRECWVERDGEQVLLAPDDIMISSPGQTLAVSLRGQGRVHIVSIQERLVRCVFAALMGFLPARSICFDTVTAGDSGSWAAWSEEMGKLLKRLEDGRQPCDLRFLHAVETMFVTALVQHSRHEFHHRLRSDAQSLPFEVSARALESAEFVVVQIRAEPWRTISLAHYARMVNLSARELKDAFWWQVGMTPAQYRRCVQLDCVHKDLCDPDFERASIADIARRWALPSSARFYRWYHHRFKEWPGETRRCALQH